MSPSRAVATTTGTVGRCGPAFPDGASVVAACRDVAWSRYAPATSAVSTSSHGHQRRCPGGGAIRPGPASGATDLGSRDMLVLRWIMLVPAVQLLSTSDARGRAIRGGSYLRTSRYHKYPRQRLGQAGPAARGACRYRALGDGVGAFSRSSTSGT